MDPLNYNIFPLESELEKIICKFNTLKESAKNWVKSTLGLNNENRGLLGSESFRVTIIGDQEGVNLVDYGDDSGINT